MPPVNFDKYGIVGEGPGQDPQRAAEPAAQGSLTAIAADGSYKLKAGPAPAADGREYLGPAAPYNPLKDKVERKPKGSKR